MCNMPSSKIVVNKGLGGKMTERTEEEELEELEEENDPKPFHTGGVITSDQVIGRYPEHGDK